MTKRLFLKSPRLSAVIVLAMIWLRGSAGGGCGVSGERPSSRYEDQNCRPFGIAELPADSCGDSEKLFRKAWFRDRNDSDGGRPIGSGAA